MTDESAADRARRLHARGRDLRGTDNPGAEAALRDAAAAARAAGTGAAGRLAEILADLALVTFEADRMSEALSHLLCARDTDPGDDAARTRLIHRYIAMVALDDDLDALAAQAIARARPPAGDPGAEFKWTNYRLLLAERTGELETALRLATRMREIWSEGGADLTPMANGLANAVRVDATLRGPEAAAADLDALLATRPEGLGLDARTNLDIARARAAFDRGDPGAALDILDAAARRYVAAAGQAPGGVLLCTAEILTATGRGDEVAALLLGPVGTVEAGTLDPADFGRSTADYLLALLALPALRTAYPRTFAGGRRRLVELLLSGLPVEMSWRGFALLSHLLEPERSRLFAAKRACEIVATTAARARAVPAARARYIEDRLAPFDRALDLLRAAGDVQGMRRIAAFRALERAKIATPRMRADPGAAIPWSAAEAALLDRIAAARAAARAADLRRAEGRAADADADAGADAEAGPDPALADIAAALLDGTAWPRRPLAPVFAAVAAPDDRAVLRLSPDGAEAVLADLQAGAAATRRRLPLARGALADRVGRLLDAAEAGRDLSALAAALHADIAAPLLGGLPDRIGALDILAEGPLAFLPFSLLQGAGPPLGARFDIAYLRGVAPDPGPAPHRPPATGCLLGLGAGGATGANADLAGPAEEARLLARHTDATAHPLTAATLARALKERPDILHLAAHFTFVADNPAASYLAGDDGTRIPAGALAGMLAEGAAPAPPLVVLSVCDGAAGSVAEATPADLPALFLASGSRAVIAAAWALSDADAVRYAAALYPALAAGAAPRAAAARAARATGIHGFKLFLRG